MTVGDGDGDGGRAMRNPRCEVLAERAKEKGKKPPNTPTQRVCPVTKRVPATRLNPTGGRHQAATTQRPQKQPMHSLPAAAHARQNTEHWPGKQILSQAGEHHQVATPQPCLPQHPPPKDDMEVRGEGEGGGERETAHAH